MSVFAAAGEAIKNSKSVAAVEESAAVKTDEDSTPTVVGEDTSRREESVKHFRMSDGSYQAVTYSDPVHYLSESNKYVEINNDLIETTVDDKAYYTNTDNNVDVLLPEKLDDSSFVYISKDDKTVGWKLKTDNQVDANVTNGSEVLEKENANKLLKVANKEEKTNTENKIKQEAKNNKSQVKYNNAYKDIDLQYNLVGNTVKESIILDKKVKQNEFPFEQHVKT